jgi:predicted amidophosphoribosyltransferase
MRETLNYWLDFLLPRQNIYSSSIHEYLTAQERAGLNPLQKTVDVSGGFIQVFAAASYSSELVQDLLHRAKFGGELAIVSALTGLILEKYGRAVDKGSSLALTFVPADPKRWQQRNYHIPQLLAASLARELQLPYLNILKKTKHTKSQVELDREDRHAALFGCFEVQEGFVQTVDNLWIVDDIITTGATLQESYRAIQQKNPKTRVSALVVAA